MKVSDLEIQEIYQILAVYMHTKEADSMKNFCQHGSVNTYDHVMYVTKMCYYLNKRFHLGGDTKVLLTGAFLHDFYLYDWHEKDEHHKWHGFSHAQTALENASAMFPLEEKEKDMIAHHMWPLTITKVPQCKEAFLLCLVDKYCSLIETLFMRSPQVAAER